MREELKNEKEKYIKIQLVKRVVNRNSSQDIRRMFKDKRFKYFCNLNKGSFLSKLGV